MGSANPVYSSMMRLYVTGHSPCGGNNYWMEYLYPDGRLWDQSSLATICTAAQTPFNWNLAGGNKWAICGEDFNEPTNPASTCQRYSTT